MCYILSRVVISQIWWFLSSNSLLFPTKNNVFWIKNLHFTQYLSLFRTKIHFFIGKNANLNAGGEKKRFWNENSLLTLMSYKISLLKFYNLRAFFKILQIIAISVLKQNDPKSQKSRDRHVIRLRLRQPTISLELASDQKLP